MNLVIIFLVYIIHSHLSALLTWFQLALHFASALALTQSSYGIAVREPEEAENEAGGDSPTYKMRIVPRAVQQNAWYIYYSFHERGRAGTSRIFVGAGLDLRGQRLETLDRPALQNRVQQLTQEYVRPVSQLLAARFPDFAFVVDEVSNGFSSGTWGIVGIEIMVRRYHPIVLSRELLLNRRIEQSGPGY